jgi:hypothetical protein
LASTVGRVSVLLASVRDYSCDGVEAEKMLKYIGEMIKFIARIFWSISKNLFFISAKLLNEKIICYKTETCYSGEITELVIEWERDSDGR